jgi:hypothetical protein
MALAAVKANEISIINVNGVMRNVNVAKYQ